MCLTYIENQLYRDWEGTIFDRYGSKYGQYTSPVGTPFCQRAFPYRDNLWAYHKYAVVKDINNVTTSTIESTFNMLGMGIQIEMQAFIKRLVNVGYLREIL